MSPIFGHGSIVAGRYRIIAPLGAGASARVFLADDLQLGRRVAIKVLHEALAEDQTFLKRFRAEALSAAALNHPNVMHVYDSGDAEVDSGTPLPYLVMEFVGGGSLRAVLDSGPTLSPSQALVVGLDAARGLEYAHQHGFVHRDIKPANLLFGEEGRLRIADFGLARALAEATWTEPEGVLLGTAKYSAPEQAMGRPVDGRSDVYSLALVLVEAVTGSVPFARDSIGATLMARTERDLEVPRSLGRLAPVLERAGRVDPALRPDAGEMVIAFFAASEDMDRPKAISLPGAISVEALEQLIAAPPAEPAPEESGPTESRTDRQTLAESGEPGEPGESGEPGQPSEPDSQSETLPIAANGRQVEIVPMATPAVPVVPDRERDLDDLTEIAAPAASASTKRTPTVTINRPVVTAATPAARIDISLDDELPRPTGRPGRAARSGRSGADADDGADDNGDDDGADDRSRRWPWVLATLLIIGSLAGGSAYWWFAVRIPTHSVLDVTGMPVDQATTELKKLGFKVTSSFVRQDGTEKDEVVGQAPKSGTELEEGKAVELTVSLGNTLVTPPELTTALDEATVTERITTAGLEVGTRTNPYDEIVPAGYLVSFVVTGPADPSGQVPKGSTIDVVISKGPQPRTMPPGLAGQTLEAVTRQLTDLRLGLNVTQEFSDEPVDTVLRLNYADNAEVARDTVVEVVVSKGPELFPIPNVVGQTGADASRTLEQNGFIVSQVVGSPTAPTIATNPPAAEMRIKGTPVIVVTGG